jgi:hypothetical protein
MKFLMAEMAAATLAPTTPAHAQAPRMNCRSLS